MSILDSDYQANMTILATAPLETFQPKKVEIGGRKKNKPRGARKEGRSNAEGESVKNK